MNSAKTAATRMTQAEWLGRLMAVDTVPANGKVVRAFELNAHIPTIICDTGYRAQAHQSGAWIADSALLSCDGFPRHLTGRLLT